jgi:hypothetical protein
MVRRPDCFLPGANCFASSRHLQRSGWMASSLHRRAQRSGCGSARLQSIWRWQGYRSVREGPCDQQVKFSISELPATQAAAPSLISKRWTIVPLENQEFNDGSNRFVFIHGATSLRGSVEHLWRWDPTICTGGYRDHPTT